MKHINILAALLATVLCGCSPKSQRVAFGEGTLTLTGNGLTYRGTCDGEEREIVMHPKQVYSLSISLAYELDLYYDCKYYNFKLLDNPKHMTKWMLAAEEIHNLHDPAWQKASKEVYDANQ